jgi:hypothetical protein
MRARERCVGSAATDGVDDLHAVAFAQFMTIVHAAWHDLVVDLHRNATTAIAGFVEQLGNAGALAAIVRVAIQGDLHSPIVTAPAWRLAGPVPSMLTVV